MVAAGPMIHPGQSAAAARLFYFLAFFQKIFSNMSLTERF
jgi:hypothetical protein